MIIPLQNIMTGKLALNGLLVNEDGPQAHVGVYKNGP